MNDLDYWRRVVQVYWVLKGTPSDEKLDLLLTVYACVAAAARHEAAIEPDGYRTESDRQQHRLWQTAEIIRADAADAEIERLLVEGDAAGLLERVDAQFDAAIRKRAEDALCERAQRAAQRRHRSSDNG